MEDKEDKIEEEKKEIETESEQTSKIDINAIQNQTLRGDVVENPGDRKRNLKKTLAIVIPSVIIIIGCIIALYFVFVPRAKTFECMDMKITLTTDFTETDNVNFLKMYQSDDMIVTVTRETIEELSSISDIDESSAESEYLALIIDLNDLLSRVEKKDGLTYADYNKTVASNGYFYRAFVFKYDGAFWMVQMTCFIRNKEDLIPEMQNYAKSITFGE